MNASKNPCISWHKVRVCERYGVYVLTKGWKLKQANNPQEPTARVKRLQYDRANLQYAFAATLSGMSVYRAAIQYNVPESTLRDRTRGNVTIDAKPGIETLFSQCEEKALMDHIVYMADIGYGYNKSEIQYMGRDFALSLGKIVKSKAALSNSWFYDFLSRWPNLKRVMPQKLSLARAKSASKEHLEAYFRELGTILTANNLHNQPERIYNIDETGVSTEHSPAKIVCSRESVAQSVTSPRSSNVTIIACGNAVGNYVPPYYIFPGKRWNDDLLKGAAPGSSGEMTKSGWSNSVAFTNYLTKHFGKYVHLSDEKDGAKTLILYDGHKSHVGLTLTEWAKKKNVILFVLPPHSSHLTQPLDVGVFGPFKSMYNHECHVFMKQNPGISVTRYNVAELTARPYTKALRPENLMSAFGKAGVYPFNSKVITPPQVAPAVIYEPESNPSCSNIDSCSQETVLYGFDLLETDVPNESNPVVTESLPPVNVPEKSISHSVNENKAKMFFQERNITTVVSKPKRKFVPPFLAGSLMKKSNQEILKKSANKKSKQVEVHKQVTKTKTKPIFKKIKSKTGLKSKSTKSKLSPAPCISGLNKGGKPIDLSPKISQSDSELSVSDEELCCVCHGWQPNELRGCQTVCFVQWGQCDFCAHWTHLKYCSSVTVLRTDSVFRCPHCLPQE